MPLPHIKNSYAGVNNLDPVHKTQFEVFFTIPAALQDKFQSDVALISQHVLSVDGLATLDPQVEQTQQRFMGTVRTYMSSKLSDTSHKVNVKLSLNLRNDTDNYIYKIFKEWNKLNYDLSTGEIRLKREYIADWLRIAIANRVGEVYREVIYKNVMMTIDDSGQGSLDYSDGTGLAEMSITFISDWAEERNV